MNSYVRAATSLLTVLSSYPAAQAQSPDTWSQLRAEPYAELKPFLKPNSPLRRLL